MLPGWSTPWLWAKQSRRNLWRHNRQAPKITFPCTYLPGVINQEKQNIYSALFECYYNSVLHRYWTTELHKLISTGSDRSTFPWIVRTRDFSRILRMALYRPKLQIKYFSRPTRKCMDEMTCARSLFYAFFDDNDWWHVTAVGLLSWRRPLWDIATYW